MFSCMGYRKAPRFLYDIDDGLELRVVCWSCKHSVRIGVAKMREVLLKKRRSMEISDLGNALRCSMCNMTQPHVEIKPIADARELAEERRMARG